MPVLYRRSTAASAPSSVLRPACLSAGLAACLAVLPVSGAGAVPGTVPAPLWQAQAAGNCLIVAASRRTLDSALDYIEGLASRSDVRLFRSSNGWFAITVAEVPDWEADARIAALIRRGYPRDMFCSSGSRFGREIDWVIEIDARRSPVRVDPPPALVPPADPPRPEGSRPTVPQEDAPRK